MLHSEIKNYGGLSYFYIKKMKGSIFQAWKLFHDISMCPALSKMNLFRSDKGGSSPSPLLDYAPG